MHTSLRIKYQLFVSDFKVNLEFSEISNFMKIRRVGTELFREDGRTDMTKATVALRNFTNAPKNKSCSVTGNV